MKVRKSQKKGFMVLKMKKIYDVIIIGSGPAGLSAAIYASRAKLDSLVLESQPMSGGQILTTYEVDNYPGIPGIGGFELGVKLKDHAVQTGANIQEGEVTEIEQEEDYYVVKTTGEIYYSRGVIVATGASHRHLGVKGEEELTGMGVSYCATCDGAFFKNRTVAVVGGGDVALEDAIFLARICKKVYVIHRRDEFRGAKVLQDNLMSLDNVAIIWDTVVESIDGEDMVESIQVSNVKTGVKSQLDVQGVFIAVGIVPNVAGVEGIAATDDNGYFVAGEDCRTDKKMIYAAGDVRTKALRQIITAAADGANAVTSLQEDLLQKCYNS